MIHTQCVRLESSAIGYSLPLTFYNYTRGHHTRKITIIIIIIIIIVIIIIIMFKGVLEL